MSVSRVHFSSATVEWPTPVELYKQLHAEFGFDYDPCPLGGNEDGLSTLFSDWRGRRVFCNPPYGSSVGEWLRRGLEADIAVFLLPARTDTVWFHDVALPNAEEIRFLRGRLQYGDHQNKRAPFPSVLIIFKRGAP